MRFRRRGRSFKTLRTIAAVILLLAAAVVGLAVWFVQGAAHPPRGPYLAKPEEFTSLSARGVKVAEENWSNRDGTQASGWLLRGEPGRPAVIMLHKYGADRSMMLNLGVKLNEATNFTILWPDLRGHGESATVKWTSFGGCETDDVSEAIKFLRGLKDTKGTVLVGDSIGIFGVELGAYVALTTAANEGSVRALALDAVPSSSDDALYSVLHNRSAFDFGLLRPLGKLGAKLYLRNCFRNVQSCEAARSIGSIRVMLLAGNDAPFFQASTVALADCFTDKSKLELHRDLPLTGLNLSAATGEQAEAYDRRVIEFFGKALGASGEVNPKPPGGSP